MPSYFERYISTAATYYPVRIVIMAFDSSALESEFEKWFAKLKANDQKLIDMINQDVDNINEVVAIKEVLKKIWLRGDN